jgi:uncharacterized protein (TIGR00730 family)
MKRIAIFCGSSSGFSELYARHAGIVGRYLAERKIQIIFGGGRLGLMGILADAAMEAGGSVVGVIPDFLNIKEVAHDGVSRLITVGSMHERKATILEMSDGFIALPGGFGTLDELFEMLTWGQLGLHTKPVGILNVNGFFSGVLRTADNMVSEGFLKKVNREMILISDRIDDLLERMAAYRAPAVPKWISGQDNP